MYCASGTRCVAQRRNVCCARSWSACACFSAAARWSLQEEEEQECGLRVLRLCFLLVRLRLLLRRMCSLQKQGHRVSGAIWLPH